jgi:FkbM family methyltransferase
MRNLRVHYTFIILKRGKSPEELSSRQLLYKTLGQLDVLPAPFSTPDPIKFVVANTSDMSFECATIRKVQAMSLADYGLPGRSVYWAEWNHVNEQPRRLADIVAVYARKGWGRLIQPGATCIDIGAHSGDTTIPIGIFSSDFRRNVRGRVYAIEPNPDVFPVLNLNLCLNTHICDFIPINMAVIRERFNEVTIKDHGNGNCNGGIVDDSYGYELRKKLELSARVSYVAKGVNLYTVYKDLLSIYDRRNLSFIKISTAGYEKEILRSSKDLFDLVKPVVFIDWFDWFSDEESVDLFDVIREIGYTPTEIETGGLARPDRKVPELVLFPKSKV